MKNKLKAPVEVILLVALILSVLELIAFIVVKAECCACSRSAFTKYMYIFEMANDLSLAYIMSYTFYLVILIPERRRQKSISKYVNIYLSHIANSLEEIIKVSQLLKKNEVHALSESPNILSTINESGQASFLSYKEHYIRFFYLFKEEYRNLSYYIAFIDDQLRDCLYDLVTSEFIVCINDLLIAPRNSNLDDVFLAHYDDAAILEAHAKIETLIGRGD